MTRENFHKPTSRPASGFPRFRPKFDSVSCKTPIPHRIIRGNVFRRNLSLWQILMKDGIKDVWSPHSKHKAIHGIHTRR